MLESRASLFPPVAESLPPRMDLSVIIVNYKARDLLLECIAALRAGLSGLETETVVVDNDSRDDSPKAIAASFPSLQDSRNMRRR